MPKEKYFKDNTFLYDFSILVVIFKTACAYSIPPHLVAPNPVGYIIFVNLVTADYTIKSNRLSYKRFYIVGEDDSKNLE